MNQRQLKAMGSLGDCLFSKVCHDITLHSSIRFPLDISGHSPIVLGMPRHSEPGPAELIAKDGRALHYIAAAAGVSIETVFMAKKLDQWPAQHRTRTGLRRALGLDQPAAPSPAPAHV